ncbi:MAG: selenium cofactor biosynthesis protein YqeC [Thermodesulfobacteriota bacterium]
MISLREGLQLRKGGVVCFVGAGGKTSLMFRLARELSAGSDSVLTTTTTKIRMPARDQSETIVISSQREEIISRAGRFPATGFHFTAVAEILSSQNKLKGYLPEFVDELWESRRFTWILVEADGAAGKSLKAPAGHEPVIPSSAKRIIGLAGLDVFGKPFDEHSVFRPEVFAKLTGLALGKAVCASAIAASFIHAEGIFRGSPETAGRYIFLNKAEHPREIEAGREIAKIVKKAAPAGIKRILIGSVLKSPPVLDQFDIP